MNTDKIPGDPGEDILRRDSIDFRHLGAFREVYQEKSHTIKGPYNRKSVFRMMGNLERAFECTLFTEGEKGRLAPTPFAERLNNDLRFLDAAQTRFEDHVRRVHEAGRILHVCSSQAVFRTREFRNFFRNLQMAGGVRPCFSPIEATQASKALSSGQCDLYVGFWADDITRFASQEAGRISYRSFRRLPDSRRTQPPAAQPSGYYIVSLEGETPPPATAPVPGNGWQTLSDTEWLQWLDHPEKCPAGTHVLGPDVQIDDKYWEAEEGCDVESRPLQATYLRQHSYEFLPSLLGRIRGSSPR